MNMMNPLQQAFDQKKMDQAFNSICWFFPQICKIQRKLDSQAFMFRIWNPCVWSVVFFRVLCEKEDLDAFFFKVDMHTHTGVINES
jgi:hypothetical protein